MEYKKTLLMPKTAFPMRGGLPNKEPKMQEDWAAMNLYEAVQEKNAGKPTFILHDGPPYANGAIHTGHAMNKIIKDMIVRYKGMSGYSSPYVPGWDTHGLPIEQQLAKKGVKRKEMSPVEFRELCEKYAREQIDIQRTGFKRLGVQAEWDNPYITLDPVFESNEIKVFGQMAEKGYIYRGKKPVYWSPSSESALAEAEIEYADVTSPSLYVAFNVKDGKGIVDNDAEFVIWTTTPWTLPANVAISVNPAFNYVEVAVADRKFIVAEGLLPAVSETLGWEETTVLKTFKGSELEYVTAQHPFYDRDSLLIVGDHVTLDAGSGCVHTAPGHGEDDYFASLSYKLEVISPVDGRGIYTDEAPGFEGVYYEKANPMIIELLEEKGRLLKLDYFSHSYPHDWRTKKPVIYRATPQWFASIDAFREEILEAIAGVDWVPAWGEQRLHNMVRDRGDWVISRQRAWGVPLPIFYGENGDAIITKETIAHLVPLFREYGSNVWFAREAKDLLPEGFTHPSSPNGTFTKETDIMDVWFDSGSSHEGVLNERDYLSRPADLYFEGSDQYRGWFNSSITTGVAINGKSPYKQILSHGMVLDGKGRKMSKSIGNTVDPNKIMNQMGADILRLWVSSSDYQADVRISDDILKQVADVYRKIRNTFRFLLGNTSDFNPTTDAVAYDKLSEADQYMLATYNRLARQIDEAYNKYEFSTVYRAVNNFVTTDLSNFYLDFAKDVVYIEAEESAARRSMQTVFYTIAKGLTQLLAPLLPHTADEIWSYLEFETAKSVHLTDFELVAETAEQTQLIEKWTRFMTLRDVVQKALEEARNEKLIGKSLMAKVTIYADQATSDLINSINNDVKQLLIVSDFEVVVGTENAPETATKGDNVAVVVTAATGETCERCRVVKTDVGTHAEHPTLCGNCASIVEEHYADVDLEA
ncbi:MULTISPECIES: isoleucine--tRNA ligase [Brochothrix]|uniref:Isoleucine--tRNA ligase n=1 Tax=Brochothrix thermosphacta TaxID=2756 RepID=A0A1D2JR27_BROTH|nr:MULTISPECIES: isoleucine--tRNA ligase [Brochothrix]ATF25284.1 isoleucine--tRNA ligase [Brochothrix thermosphacta]ATH84667.1 isoleucine--tRNA ligase [Brochothrix thermosphacta]MBR5525775.1 isoleucine--tRNA ligase [Brochothrix sp.]MPQ27718.1 isoleucine--tRNA ligase [Brochothrix thermosphacta]ODJ47899.1 isoleucine--tRNA ligase [Brochothrix thermosphacta]